MSCSAHWSVALPSAQDRRSTACAGFTLVELIVAIVVLSIAVIGLSGLLTSIAARSSSNLASTQAAFIASAYLEEILSKPFQDPDINNEISRAVYDDVWDYRIHDDLSVRDRLENVIPGLNQFRVSVRVHNVQLGPGPAANNVPARHVEVTVTSPTGSRTMLSGYRTNYVGQVLLP